MCQCVCIWKCICIGIHLFNSLLTYLFVHSIALHSGIWTLSRTSWKSLETRVTILGKPHSDLVSIPAPPQLPFKIPHMPTNRDHNAVNRGTLGVQAWTHPDLNSSGPPRRSTAQRRPGRAGRPAAPDLWAFVGLCMKLERGLSCRATQGLYMASITLSYLQGFFIFVCEGPLGSKAEGSQGYHRHGAVQSLGVGIRTSARNCCRPCACQVIMLMWA